MSVMGKVSGWPRRFNLLAYSRREQPGDELVSHSSFPASPNLAMTLWRVDTSRCSRPESCENCNKFRTLGVAVARKRSMYLDNWQKSMVFPYRGRRGKLSFILISVFGSGLAKRDHRLLYSGTSSIDKCTCLVNASCVCVCVWATDCARARAHDYYFARNSSRRANDNLRNVNAARRMIGRWEDIISKYISSKVFISER